MTLEGSALEALMLGYVIGAGGSGLGLQSAIVILLTRLVWILILGVHQLELVTHFGHLMLTVGSLPAEEILGEIAFVLKVVLIRGSAELNPEAFVLELVVVLVHGRIVEEGKAGVTILAVS